MKRSQPRRDWTAARAKCEDGCRICGEPAEAAHLIGRVHDFHPPLPETDRYRLKGTLVVHPDRICPMCPAHHRAFDDGELDLLPYLTLSEQLQAVADAGSIEAARNRLIGKRVTNLEMTTNQEER